MKKAQAPKKARQSRRASLTARRRLVDQALEHAWTDASNAQREQLARHVFEFSLAAIGALYGIDMSEAMLVTPSDMTSQLIEAVARVANTTGAEYEDVVQGLIVQLKSVANGPNPTLVN